MLSKILFLVPNNFYVNIIHWITCWGEIYTHWNAISCVHMSTLLPFLPLQPPSPLIWSFQETNRRQGERIQSDPRIMDHNIYELTKVNGCSPARKCLDQRGIRNYYIKNRKKLPFPVYKRNPLYYAGNN